MDAAARKRLRLKLAIALALLPRWVRYDFWRRCEPQHERAQKAMVDALAEALEASAATLAHEIRKVRYPDRPVAPSPILIDSGAFAMSGVARITPVSIHIRSEYRHHIVSKNWSRYNQHERKKLFLEHWDIFADVF